MYLVRRMYLAKGMFRVEGMSWIEVWGGFSGSYAKLVNE